MRVGCELPPFGAFTAASTIVRMSSIGIGSGFKRRNERWVNIASPTGIERRLLWSSLIVLSVRRVVREIGWSGRDRLRLRQQRRDRVQVLRVRLERANGVAL